MDSDDNEKILKVIRSLRKGDPLRQQAESVLADPGVSIDDLQPILQPFERRSARHENQQTVAGWLINRATWSDDQRTSMTVQLSARLEKAEPGFVAARWTCLCVFTCLLCVAAIAVLGEYRVYPIAGLLVSLALIGLSIFGAGWERSCRLRQARIIITCLGDLGHPASLASLAKAIKLQHDLVRRMAVSSLTRVIANLRSEHYGTLPSQTVPALCKALPIADRDIMLVILRALTFIGDGRAITAVERLALKPPSDEIGRAAAELLPILKQREMDTKAPTQLLRASVSKAYGKQELLRGVDVGQVDDPAVLVRAGIAKNDQA